MTEVAYRERTVAELVDASVQLFRRIYPVLVGITAVGYIPWIAASTLARRMLAGVDHAAGAGALLPPLAPALITVVGALWFVVVSAGCIAAASEAYLGRRPDIGSSLRRALRRAWPIIGTAIVTWLAVGVGLFLLLVGALYFFARFALASTVALLEERGVGASLKRSEGLSRGRKLHILGALGSVWLIYLVLGITAVFLVEMTGRALLAPLADAVITIAVSPLIAVASAVLYYDLRIRSEGFDVDLLERKLRNDGEPAP